MAARILWQTRDHTVQNFPLEPSKNGLPRREGGKFRPTLYSPGEDRSHCLSPQEYRAEYAPSFESGSVIDQSPINRCGTGNRKVEKLDKTHSRHENTGTLENLSRLIVFK